MDIKLLRDGEFFILKQEEEVIRYCGCCGKRFDARAAAVLSAKLQAGELDWTRLYDSGRLAELRKDVS
jgi:hypothetical protein